MNEQEERIYERGYRSALRMVLGDVLRGLMDDGDAERWRLERMDTVAALRRVCERYGDNDWEDNLHLADVVEKHLERNLDWATDGRGIRKVVISGVDQNGEPVEDRLSILHRGGDEK